MIRSNKRDWAERLVEATPAYNTTKKTTTRSTPYELVYGKKALLYIEYEYNTLKIATPLDMDIIEAHDKRLQQLNALDEYR